MWGFLLVNVGHRSTNRVTDSVVLCSLFKNDETQHILLSHQETSITIIEYQEANIKYLKGLSNLYLELYQHMVTFQKAWTNQTGNGFVMLRQEIKTYSDGSRT